GHVHVPDHLLVMDLGPLGGHTLEAIHGLEIDRTDIGGAFVTDTPPLTLQQPLHGVFRQFAPGHQGPLPFGELPVAGRAAQPFNVLVPPGPRPMRDVAFAGTIEPGTVWIRAREWRISLWCWRRRCHHSPPMVRHGLQDTGSTPVSPRYCSPGLPGLLRGGKCSNRAISLRWIRTP